LADHYCRWLAYVLLYTMFIVGFTLGLYLFKSLIGNTQKNPMPCFISWQSWALTGNGDLPVLH
jgi:hypothetical protein